jgi:hypothetical protein
VQQRSLKRTDPVALNLFRQLRKMTIADSRLVLAALDTRLAGAVAERVVVVRAAIDLFREETGEALSKKRYERWRMSRADTRSLPSATFIAHTWGGSWSHAMDQLGLEPAPDHAAWRMAVAGSTRSDEELLEHLHECAAEIGHTPRIYEYADWQRERLRNGTHGVRYLGTQTYRKRFGDWPQAVRAAGLPYNGGTEPRTRATDWAAGQPLQLLREAAQEAGSGRLLRSQYVAWRERRLAQQRAAGDYTAVAAAETIAYHYGGWLAALAAAGLISDDAASNLRLGAGRAFTAQEIDDCIARFALETAEVPSSRLYRSWRQSVMTREANLHLPAHTVLARRLDGWANVRTQVMLARRTARREASGD